MENFNPIKELKPEDPFNAPEGESSDEIESIRLTLISTRKKTRELVNVIKKKNLDFVKDTTTIKDLDRRLRITIARIPIMRGDASTRSDQDEDPSMIFRSFSRRTRTTKTTKPTITRVRPTPKIGERIKNAIIDAILIRLGMRIKIPTKIPGLGKLFKPLLKRLGIKIGTKKVGKKALEEALESTASKKSTGFNIYEFFRKRFSKKLKPKTLVKKSKYELRRENMRRVRLEGEKRTGLFDKKKKVEYENFFDRGRVENAASGYTGPGDLLGTLANRTVKTIKDIVKTKPFKVTRSRRKNIKNLKGQDKVTYSDKVDLNAIKKESEKANEIQKEIYRNFNELNELNKKIKLLEDKLVKISGSKNISEAQKKTYSLIKKELEDLLRTRRIIKKRNPTSTFNKTKAFNFNAKPMNNDIAMLNRDTSATRVVVIATGEMA